MNNKEIAERLYNLKIGENYFPDSSSVYTRAPGGWIYGDRRGTCFIPFNNEFM